MKHTGNQDAQISRLRDIRCFLLDMDGTVTLGEESLPGASSFFESIRGREAIFVTNNSSHSRTHYLNRLKKIGIPPEAQQVMTSTDALILYLKKEYEEPVTVFPVGTPGFEADLKAFGIQMEKRRDQPIDAVVLAFDTTLVYEKLVIACDYIRKGKPYLATNPDRVCPLANGRVLPDCGALIAYMETCTDRSPLRVMGKPETTLIEMVLESRCYQRHELAMVGDRLYTDIKAAHNAGILSIAVLSGETTREEIESSSIKPDLIFQDIGELARTIDAIKQNE